MATKKNTNMEPDNKDLYSVESTGQELLTPENAADEGTETANPENVTGSAQDTSDVMDLNKLLESMDGESEEEFPEAWCAATAAVLLADTPVIGRRE